LCWVLGRARLQRRHRDVDEDNGGTITAATLQLGPAGNRLLTFNFFGFLAIRSDGFAANMVLSADASLPLGLASIEAAAVFIVNTTGRDVFFTIPGGATNPNGPTGVTLTIPAGPAIPARSSNTQFNQLINGQAWSVDSSAPGAYGVVFLWAASICFPYSLSMCRDTC
jgi:hypothetical protein